MNDFVFENIEDVLKAKPNEEIKEITKNLNTLQLFRIGSSSRNKELIKIGIEKAETKLFVRWEDDRLKDLDKIWIFERFLKPANEYTLRLRNVNNNVEEWSALFFAPRYKPLSKKEVEETLNLLYSKIEKLKKYI